MAQDDVVRIREVVNGRPISGLMARVPILCVLLLMTEGIDAFGVGFVGPYLSKLYDISAQQLSFVYTGTVIASLLGATLLAPAADKFGRRRILLLTSAMASIGTFLTPLAATVPTLFVVRFVVGLAFGAALPCTIALAADYAPARRRNAVLLMMNTGINVGMMLAGLAAATIVPAWGWQALLYASAALSAVAALAAWIALPESLQFLARRDPYDPVLRGLMHRLDPALAGISEKAFVAEPPAARAGSPKALFTDGRAFRTVLLWSMMSFGYVLINFNSYWLPTTILENGASMREAGLLVSLGKLGGICGAIAVGWLADRRGLPRVLSYCLVGTAAFIMLTGTTAAVPALAVLFLTLSCVLLNPITGGTQTLTVGSYPNELQSVATGWVTGFARLIGGGAGTLLGGYMIQQHWQASQMAGALAMAPLASWVMLRLLRRHDTPGSAGRAEVPLVPQRA